MPRRTKLCYGCRLGTIPDWCSAGISETEFSDFAKAFGGLTHREAHVFYTKHDFWRARAGVSQYHYGA